MTAPTPYEHFHVEVQYTAGVWTDITADVDTMTEAIYATNGSTAETTGDPASMTLVLHNPGFKYTPGNTLSAFALTSAMPIRLYELYGETRFYIFTGFIEFPEIGSVNVSMTQDQTIAVAAVDQLSRWERSPTFPSTLTAHVMYAGGSALKWYFPCLDDAGVRFYNVISSSGRGYIYEANIAGVGSGVTPTDGVKSITAGGGPPVLADDANPMRMTAQTGTLAGSTANASSLDMRMSLATGFDIGAGQIVTMVGWYRPEMPTLKTATLLRFFDSQGGVQVNVDSAGVITASCGGTLSGTITPSNSRVLPDEAWVPIALRYGWDTAVFELWIGSDRYTGTLSGSPAGPNSTGFMSASIFYSGSFAHVQFYIGPPADWDFTAYLAQLAVAATALERQSTGDRIRTLARYGGKTDADLSMVDKGGSIMQAARLAGQTVAAAMYDARDTEQGELFIDGSGLLNFDDRRTLLNI